MQQSIVKFIALSYSSTCFGHYNAHHQEPVKLPLQPLVSCLCSSQEEMKNTDRKPKAATAV
jgi:hypothetical protein